jgi:hypothetical protein
MPPPLSRAVAQVVEPRILPAQIPYNAPAPQITSNPPFANTAPQQAQAFGSSFATQSTSDSTAPQKKRARAELWIMALAGALGLVITLHRNAILFDVAAGLGAKSLYLQVEKSLLGEPSVDTPRGVQQLLQQSEHKGPSAR